MADRDRLSAPASARPSVPAGPARAPIWVLEESEGAGAAPAMRIAERLGVSFRRVPLRWNWLAPAAGLARGGSLLGLADPAASRRLIPPHGVPRPRLVLSSGGRAAAVSLFLKTTLGCPAVHCVEPGMAGRLGHILARRRRGAGHDLLVVPDDFAADVADGRVLPVLAPPHRVGPPALREATERWGERLDYLAHPRVVLLVGGRSFGTDMEPARAHVLGRTVARLVGGLGGSVLAATTRRTGREASEALAAGLGPVMHLIHRWGEPGEDPRLGFLAVADAVIVTADATDLLLEACATEAPVFVTCPELAGASQRRLVRRLIAAGQVRPLRGSLSPWPRRPLDEAGRIAGEIIRRLGPSVLRG